MTAELLINNVTSPAHTNDKIGVLWGLRLGVKEAVKIEKNCEIFNTFLRGEVKVISTLFLMHIMNGLF